MIININIICCLINNIFFNINRGKIIANSKSNKIKMIIIIIKLNVIVFFFFK